MISTMAIQIFLYLHIRSYLESDSISSLITVSSSSDHGHTPEVFHLQGTHPRHVQPFLKRSKAKILVMT